MKLVACLAATFIMLTGSLAAQSLGDVAKKEEARRKQAGKATKVYTNKDVKPAPPASSGATQPAAGGASTGEATAPPPADDQKPAEEQASEPDEKQWRTRMTEARTALDRSRTFADALQSRINALWADFTARDNPVERARIEQERKKAIAELDRVKSEIQAQTKAIADLEEEARKAGVPPGWLR